jgi:hypothetical protein
MRTDGVFKTKLVRIKNWPTGKPLQLIPFGDIHHDSPSFSEHKFKEFCAYAKKQKDALFLGMGDYFDGYSTSERAIIYDHGLHESSRKREDMAAKGRIGKLAKEIEFMRGKLIGLMGGNHFSCFPDGSTSDQVLAGTLGTTYLGACAAIRLVIQRPGANDSASVDIFAHHGKGGGTTAGGKFNSVEKLAGVCDADIYLMGDNHARGVFPMGDRLTLTNTTGGLQVKSRTRWIGRTGSFLRAYVENESSYVVDAAMSPANLGWIEFTLTPKRTTESGNLEIEIGAKQ